MRLKSPLHIAVKLTFSVQERVHISCAPPPPKLPGQDKTRHHSTSQVHEMTHREILSLSSAFVHETRHYRKIRF